MTKNLSKGPNPSQEDRKQHQVTFHLLYSRASPSKAYLFIDTCSNSQFYSPDKLLHVYYAWATHAIISFSTFSLFEILDRNRADALIHLFFLGIWWLIHFRLILQMIWKAPVERDRSHDFVRGEYIIQQLETRWFNNKKYPTKYERIWYKILLWLC